MDNQPVIKLREVVLMSKLEIVSKVRINGELYLQKEMDPDEFRRLVEARIDEVMVNTGFEREKTA